MMHDILERKKYNHRIFAWLPTHGERFFIILRNTHAQVTILDDFVNANLPAPDFENLSSKLPELNEPIEEESGSKELSVDETDSSASNEMQDECLGDKPTNSTDYVPTDPFPSFQKCSVAKLNIDPVEKEAENVNCALSASSTYSSTNSNPPSTLVQGENEPLDPEQMDVLLKTSSSAIQTGPPPPPYSEIDNQPSTSNEMDSQPASMPSVDPNSDNEDDGVSLTCSETPKVFSRLFITIISTEFSDLQMYPTMKTMKVCCRKMTTS
jgi:hypothetical protein